MLVVSASCQPQLLGYSQAAAVVLCRALDVLPLKPSRRTPGRAKSLNKKPARHKPASAKPANAPRGPVESREPLRPKKTPKRQAAPAGEAAGANQREQGQREAADVDALSAESTASLAEGGGKGERSSKNAGGKGGGRAHRGGGGRSRGRGRGRGRKRGRGASREPDEDVIVLEPDLAAGEAPQRAGERVSAFKEQATPPEAGAPKKRRGDLEFENQLLMAMQARPPLPPGPPPLVMPPWDALSWLPPPGDVPHRRTSEAHICLVGDEQRRGKPPAGCTAGVLNQCMCVCHDAQASASGALGSGELLGHPPPGQQPDGQRAMEDAFERSRRSRLEQARQRVGPDLAAAAARAVAAKSPPPGAPAAGGEAQGSLKHTPSGCAQPVPYAASCCLAAGLHARIRWSL